MKLAVVGGTPSLSFTSYDGGVVATVPFAWDDGNFHTYRILAMPLADFVAVIVDDVLLSTLAATSFAPRTDTAATRSDVRGVFGVGDGGTSVSLWDSISVIPASRISSGITRTFGIWLGGARTDINSYALPRTDGTTAPNSSLTATFEAMDWRTSTPCRTRLYCDPAWGVGFYRPDLPLPPTATEDFVTETTDPSAAWINVEYAGLPRSKGD